jgi:hypothetical protein
MGHALLNRVRTGWPPPGVVEIEAVVVPRPGPVQIPLNRLVRLLFRVTPRVEAKVVDRGLRLSHLDGLAGGRDRPSGQDQGQGGKGVDLVCGFASPVSCVHAPRAAPPSGAHAERRGGCSGSSGGPRGFG